MKIVKLGPVRDSLLSKGRSITFNPAILYKETPDSKARKRLRSKPTPLNEKGLMGVEKDPFLGIK